MARRRLQRLVRRRPVEGPPSAPRPPRDDRVAEAGGVLGGIEIRGVAELIADAEVVGAAARRIAARYLGDVEGPEYADSITGDDAVIIRVAPGVVRAWDFADER
jgi:hypothetical protein